jgi:hypothetical protein
MIFPGVVYKRDLNIHHFVNRNLVEAKNMWMIFPGVVYKKYHHIVKKSW